jgi:two-component system CheB/CheR fusion protein
MELAVSAFHIGPRRYFTGIVRNISDRKRLEGELRHKLDDLAAADRQKNEFLAMLGHELRNPLGPMRNALHIMKLSRADSAALDAAQGMIERQLQHMVRLVDDLLDVSRIIRGKIELRRERIDLSHAIRRAVETAQPAVDANGHTVEVSVPLDPVYVMGDLLRLAQVISNLLTNASKYSTRPGPIHVTLARAGDQALVSVKDEGEGIPPELLPHVFDLFVQGDHTLARSQGGLGIGLTLVRRLIEMHHGEVSAFSAGKGSGSEFRIRIPVLPDAATPPRVVRTAEPIRGAARRVLVVDDNVDAVDSISKLLGLFGHDVQSANDGPTALSLLSRFKPEVFVLDIGLPGMDGYELARRLRGMAPFHRATLIAVTGYGQEDDRRRAREAGFDHHLTKPVDPEQLQRLIVASASLEAG